MKEKTAYLYAVAGGALLWLLTSAISGRAEAWDAPFYWTLTYPLSIGLAGFLGYLCPQRPWRWGLVVMLAQAVMLVFAGSDLSLLPLGLILFSVLALPAIAAAKAGARMRLRKSAGADS